jgi:hypothetical protein
MSQILVTEHNENISPTAYSTFAQNSLRSKHHEQKVTRYHDANSRYVWCIFNELQVNYKPDKRTQFTYSRPMSS